MTMTCREVTQLLIDYVENDMSQEIRMVFERHMCGCEPCQVYLNTYWSTILMTHRLPAEEPLPLEFEQRLRAACEEAMRDC